MVTPGAGMVAPVDPVGDCVPKSAVEMGFSTADTPSKRIKPNRAMLTNFELMMCVSDRTAMAFLSTSFVPQPGTVAAFGENGRIEGALE